MSKQDEKDEKAAAREQDRQRQRQEEQARAEKDPAQAEQAEDEARNRAAEQTVVGALREQRQRLASGPSRAQREAQEDLRRARDEEQEVAQAPFPTATRSTARPGATSTQNVPAVAPFDAGAARAARTAQEGSGIRVQATQMGYYDHTRRRIGDVFVLHADEDFAEQWMQRVKADTPLRATGPNKHLADQHDEIVAMRHAAPGTVPMAVATDDVETQATGDRNPLGER